MNQELENYIKQERDLGTSDQEIKQKLIKNGWQEGDISGYFSGDTPQMQTPMSTNNQATQATRVSPRNKKIGIFWLVAPTLFMIMILMIYGIVTFSMQNSESLAILGAVNIILGFAGMLDTLMIIAGVIIGIIYLNKKEYVNIQFDPRSGKGNASEIPEEIKGWNWGAAGLTWIWGISNGVWLSLLAFIPYFGMIWWIFLGIKGNKWAWQSSQWASVEDFQRSQDKWKPWGIVFLLLPVLVFLFMTISFTMFILGS